MDSAATDVDIEDLAAVAAEWGRAEVAQLVPPGDKRRWHYAVRDERYEVIVIAWPPGTGLGMHDHAGSLAAIHVTNGRLRERYLDDDGRIQIRWLSAGETIELSATHEHEVINFDEAEVVSVHVYSPPLADADFRTDNEIDIAWITTALTR